MQRQYIYIQSGSVKIRKESTMQNITEADVTTYLQEHTGFLDDFVRNHVSSEKLELWITERTQKLSKDNSSKNISLCQWRNYVYSSIHQILQDMFHPSTKLRIMWELCTFITHIIDAENFDLYIFDQNNSNIVYKHMGYNCSDKPYLVKQNFDSCAAVKYVVKKRGTPHDARGNISVGKNFPENDKDIQHSMYQTIMRSDGELMAVVEFSKKTNEKCFNEQDNELAESYLFWGGVLLHYSQLLLTTNKQRKLNEFLLIVVKSIFQDMISMDVLIVKITHFAQRLVNADRASLFLIDSQSREIYAKVFDIGEKSLENISYEHSQEIRFPIGIGLAGQVALSGQTLNIDNVELDPRFNCSIDQKTGYKTKNVLCMPIIVNRKIIGVMEMLNKRSGSFDKEDESSFEIFAIYCGLALYNSELWEKIRCSEERHRVTLEVLSYHNTCSEDDVKLTLKKFEQTVVPNIDDFFFNPFQYDDFEKAQLAIQMFIDLFGQTKFDRETLVRFVLTVKKSYRNVPYHNWTHGFSVANCMFNLIKKSSKVFLANESLALFIGSLCHDLDHRGKNNKFMLETASPLAAIYTTSTMEHHHFNQTVTILQQSGHNILAKLSSCEYKRLLTLMKHCILATDLALFFPYKENLSKWLDDKTFCWKIKDHRMHVLAIAMTASDLSASAKPWDIQCQTANVIFEEFYQQGEAEKAAGRTPLPMMDRDRSHKQAVFQIGFINSICIPCYDALYRLIPASEPLLLMCKENLQNWERLAENVD